MRVLFFVCLFCHPALRDKLELQHAFDERTTHQTYALAVCSYSLLQPEKPFLELKTAVSLVTEAHVAIDRFGLAEEYFNRSHSYSQPCS